MDKRTILIVEDNRLNMKLALDILEARGFNVLGATDGLIALDMLKECTPDLILLDINLPVMSGFEVFAKMRENPKLDSVPILALTALAMTEDIEKISGLGFNGYIAKPMNTKDFLLLIDESLASPMNDG